jgi:hypothetical protein
MIFNFADDVTLETEIVRKKLKHTLRNNSQNYSPVIKLYFYIFSRISGIYCISLSTKK